MQLMTWRRAVIKASTRRLQELGSASRAPVDALLIRGAQIINSLTTAECKCGEPREGDVAVLVKCAPELGG